MRYTTPEYRLEEPRALNEKAMDWLAIADYDLETARVLLKAARYVYVAFMCHQVIEKALEAVIADGGVEPPRIHRLGRLAEQAGLLTRMGEAQLAILDTLEPLNVGTRYAEASDRLRRDLDEQRAAQLLAQTEELYTWIKAE